jgi:hypothetical protein
VEVAREDEKLLGGFKANGFEGTSEEGAGSLVFGIVGAGIAVLELGEKGGNAVVYSLLEDQVKAVGKKDKGKEGDQAAVGLGLDFLGKLLFFVFA